MSPPDPNLEKFQQAVATTLRQHWWLFLLEGIVLVVLGMAAVAAPPLAGIAVELLFGWVLFVSGIVGLATTFMLRQAPGFWWSLLSAAIGITAGVTLLRWPLSGVVSLTFVLIVFFLVEGVASIMYGFAHRREMSGRWGWMLVSGVVDLVLATSIMANMPASAGWALGLLVGINMIFGGGALIGMALHARTPTA